MFWPTNLFAPDLSAVWEVPDRLLGGTMVSIGAEVNLKASAIVWSESPQSHRSQGPRYPETTIVSIGAEVNLGQ